MNLFSNSTDQKPSCCTAQLQRECPWSTQPDTENLQSLRLMLCPIAYPKTSCLTWWGPGGPSASAGHSWSEKWPVSQKEVITFLKYSKFCLSRKTSNTNCTAPGMQLHGKNQANSRCYVRVRNWEAARKIHFQPFSAKDFISMGKKNQISQWWTTELISKHIILQCSVLLANNILNQ